MGCDAVKRTRKRGLSWYLRYSVRSFWQPHSCSPCWNWAGFDLKTVAIPVGLLLNGVTTTLALTTYARKKLVDWSGGWPMALTAVVGAPIGAMMEPYVPHNALMLGFAAMVAIAAGRMIWTSVFAKKAANWSRFAPA